MALFICISTGDCREGAQGQHWRFGQKEVPGAIRLDGRPVLLFDPQAHPSAPRGRPVLFRQQCHSAHIRHNGLSVPGWLFTPYTLLCRQLFLYMPSALHRNTTRRTTSCTLLTRTRTCMANKV